MSPTPKILRATTLTSGLAPCQGARGGLWTATNEKSDADLIESIATGDRLAMQALYTRHSTKLYRFALRLLGDAAVAEDVVCETFLDVWHQAWSFGGRLQVSTWLLSITRLKICAAQRGGSMQAANDNIRKPMANHRAIMELVYCHRKAVDEIAGIIGAPRNTVRLMVLRARQRLAKLLDCQWNRNSTSLHGGENHRVTSIHHLATTTKRAINGYEPIVLAGEMIRREKLPHVELMK